MTNENRPLLCKERRWTPEVRERLRFHVVRRQGLALESSPGFRELGRWSLYAWAPRATFSVSSSAWCLVGDWPGERPSPTARPMEALRTLLRQTHRRSDSTLPFQGGWAGYFGYDLAPEFERLPRRTPKQTALPDVQLAYFDRFALADERTETLFLVAADAFAESPSQLRSRLESLKEAVAAAPPATSARQFVESPPESEWSQENYLRRAERVIEYIRAGDIFQANLSHRFHARLKEDWQSPARLFALWRRCRERSPAPFSAYLGDQAWNILSTSPERFLLLTPEGTVETRPIKGTRPRSADPEQDARFAAQLLASAKDRAELTMIVDLARNDLGRCCRFGSIRVRESAALESFSNVHHLVATVEGRMRPECDFVDLLAAAFPGGSITGAPKIRAMQIIDELEDRRRGVYTGAIGYISDHGRADFNIAIRTLVLEGGIAHYHVGGGIVADSAPEAEYRETLVKGNRLRSILLEESPPEPA